MLEVDVREAQNKTSDLLFIGQIKFVVEVAENNSRSRDSAEWSRDELRMWDWSEQNKPNRRSYKKHKQSHILPGTLVACCKPNSGAGVVWMEISLRGWVRLPATKEWWLPQGDPTKQLLHQGSRSSRKNARLKSCLHSNVERKVKSLVTTDDVVFLANLCFESSQ